MGAPDDEFWRVQSVRAYRRVRRLQMIEQAGWDVLIFCMGIAAGAALTLCLR